MYKFAFADIHEDVDDGDDDDDDDDYCNDYAAFLSVQNNHLARCWLIFSNDRIAQSRRLGACYAVSIVQSLKRKEIMKSNQLFWFVQFVRQVYHFALIQCGMESIAL